MVHIRLFLSMLCAVCALGLALLKPMPASADEPPAAPASTALGPQALPVVKAHRVATRTTQFHLPLGTRVADFAKRLVGTRYVYGGSSPPPRVRRPRLLPDR